ncbi:MAG: MerR family transcriptional regulator [Proteobacteria bacterium]|nr:MerR family transcriptional regulator [Pseudomonadota bacterium]
MNAEPALQETQEEIEAVRPAFVKKEKAAGAFRTISEVADELGVQQHVLRFWETKFTQVKPLKRGGGRRYYRPEDVVLIKRIHHLLYTEGYTIKGVQKLLKGQGKVQAASAEQDGSAAVLMPAVKTQAMPQKDQQLSDPGLSSRQRAILEAMLGELKDLRSLIRE